MPIAPGVPSIVTCHDLIPLDGARPVQSGATARHPPRTCLLLQDRVGDSCTGSRATRDDVARSSPAMRRRVEVVPNGSGFSRPADERRRVRAQRVSPSPTFSSSAATSRSTTGGDWRLATMVGRRGMTPWPRLVLQVPDDSRFDEGGPGAENRGAPAGSPFDRESCPRIDGGAVQRSDTARLSFARRGVRAPGHRGDGSGVPVACSRIAALTELTGGAAALFDPGRRLARPAARTAARFPRRTREARGGGPCASGLVHLGRNGPRDLRSLRPASGVTRVSDAGRGASLARAGADGRWISWAPR